MFTERAIRLLSGVLFFSFLFSPFSAAENNVSSVRIIDRWGVRRNLNFYKEMRPETKAMVFVFVGDGCPVLNKYRNTLIDLFNTYRSKGIEFFAVYSNSTDNVQSMAAHAQKQDYPYQTLLDYEGSLARTFRTERTAEVVILDTNKEVNFDLVVYQGPIDSQITEKGINPRDVRNYVRDALTDFLANTKYSTRKVNEVSGCELELPSKKDVSKSKVTYNKDIAPLIQKNCQSCHRPGSVAPFTLFTYEDVSRRGKTIVRRIQDRLMPPWHATLNPKFGSIKHDNRLTQNEINLITEWVEAGAIEGDGKPPKNPDWQDPKLWNIGKPDFIYEMPQEFTVPATGYIDYQFFHARLNSPKDLWVKKMEIKPGDASVVHHIVVHLIKAVKPDVDLTNVASMFNLYGITGENAHVLNGYVPGDENSSQHFNEGEAQLIPKNTDLIFELHYTPSGTETKDRSKLGLVLTEERPTQLRQTKIFRKARGEIVINPGDPHARSEQLYYFKEDVQLLNIYPHIHARGKDYKLELVHDIGKPNERTEVILTIPIYDFNWQRTYALEKPLFLKAGTALRATMHWDNSPYNPNNPDPKKKVHFGLQTDDEMFSTRFNYRTVE